MPVKIDNSRLSFKHAHCPGGTESPTYRSWRDMRARCEKPKLANWKDYGGRGIKVCDRWQSFENFLADMGERPAGLTLDRKDNEGHYCKENCRWATRKEQMRNRRPNRMITYQGRTLCMIEWAEQAGITRHTLKYRLNAGWSMQRALETPVKTYQVVSLTNPGSSGR